MSEEAEDTGPLKEILRLGKFLAHICKVIGHDFIEDGCCQRCGAKGTGCKERDEMIAKLTAELQMSQHRIIQLERELNSGAKYGGYKQSDRTQWTSASENEKMAIRWSPTPDKF